MRFASILGLVAVAIIFTSAAVVVPPSDRVGATGEGWRQLPLPKCVSLASQEKSEPDDCHLSITVITTKCAGGPYRWGAAFQAYDEFSQNSWTVSSSYKGTDGDLYAKLNFKAKCGTNGRIFPTDQIENMNPDKVQSQGVRFFASKSYSVAWIETANTDDETGEPRTAIAAPRLLYWSDTPTAYRGIINDTAPMGFENTHLTTRQSQPYLYAEFCK